MKTYISDKEQLYLKWAWLVIGIPLYTIGIINSAMEYSISRNSRTLIEVFMMVLMSIIFSFYAFAIRVLLVEDDKIILKGFWRKITYDLSEFQEISKRWGSESYKIMFNDGKLFRFIPNKRMSNYFFFNFSTKEKVDYLNLLMRDTIEKHTSNKRDGFKSV